MQTNTLSTLCTVRPSERTTEMFEYFPSVTGLSEHLSASEMKLFLFSSIPFDYAQDNIDP